MTEKMESAVRTVLAEKASYVLSLAQTGKIKAVLAQCRREAGSHVEAIDQNGWTHVREGDEYSPFGDEDYAVFTASGNSMTAQLAVSFTSGKMYTTVYLPEKDGWYDWEEYESGAAEPLVNSNGKKTFSFGQALEQARQRVRKANASANGRADASLNGKAGAKDLPQNSPEKATVNMGLRENLREGIGLPLYSEDAASTENHRQIEVPGIQSLEELKDKIITVKSGIRFLRTAASAPIELTVTNVGSAPIKFAEFPGSYLSNAEINVYFVTYDGAEFVYCGRLSQ